MAYKVFTNGSVLNASEINDNLMNQSVMVFSNSAARSAALTSPVEGMLTWLEDVNRYEYRDGSGAWVALGSSAILQVVSTTKTDTFTMSSTTYADVTGLSVSITPSSASNKILVTGSVNIGSGGSGVNGVGFKLLRGSTDIALADSAGSRIRSYSGAETFNSAMMSSALNFLDSPASTASLTYKIQLASAPAALVTVNRWMSDGDNNTRFRGVSTITVMEVAG